MFALLSFRYPHQLNKRLFRICVTSGGLIIHRNAQPILLGGLQAAVWPLPFFWHKSANRPVLKETQRSCFIRSYTPVLTVTGIGAWALALLGWFVDGPNNNFEIWRAEGQCTVQGQPELLVSIRIQMQRCQACPFTSLSFSFVIVNGGGGGEGGWGGGAVPISAAHEAPGQNSRGSMNHAIAYRCFQESHLSPPWNSGRTVLVLWYYPGWLYLTHNRPLFLMLSPQPCWGVFYISHLDLLHCIFFFLRDPHKLVLNL